MAAAIPLPRCTRPLPRRRRIFAHARLRLLPLHPSSFLTDWPRSLPDRRAGQLGIPSIATTAIATAMPAKKTTHAQLRARQASCPAISACDRK